MKTITFLIQRSFSAVGVLAILFACGLNSSRAQDIWTQKANFGGTARSLVVGFSIGSKGYFGTGVTCCSAYHNDFWEYDPTTDAWTQKADFGGIARYSAVGFSIGSKGYVGTGEIQYDPWFTNDFWEYDPDTNTWTQKADFGGAARTGAVGFSIGSKGYIGTGSIFYAEFKDFWMYDPATNSWTKKADFGGTARGWGVGFSIGSKGYIGMGVYFYKDFWEYDPGTNGWTQKADYGGMASGEAVGFSIGNEGYVGTGGDEIYPYYENDFWKYYPSTNIWTQKADFGGGAREGGGGFSIGSKGYIGTGYGGNLDLTDFWEYTPDTSSCAVPINLSVTNITSSSVKVMWDTVGGAAGYKVRYRVSSTNPWTLKNAVGNSKTLKNLSPNTKYNWEVKTYCTIAPGTSSDWSPKQHFTTAPLRVGDESVQEISFQIYPNPAEDRATIQFTLQQSSHVSVKVYDVSGKEVITVFDSNMEQGEHTVLLNTNHFSKGVYLMKMISDFGIENQKLMVQ